MFKKIIAFRIGLNVRKFTKKKTEVEFLRGR